LASIPLSLHAQNPEWKSFTSAYPSIHAIAYDGDYLWIGSYGLTRIKKDTGEITLCNRANSGLPDNNITVIEIDSHGEIWIGTLSRDLVKYDGENWIVYNEVYLPSNRVHSIIIDTQSNILVGQMKICTLVDAYRSPGHYTAHWSGLNDDGIFVSSGVYLCRIKSSKFVKTKKMILLR